MRIQSFSVVLALGLAISGFSAVAAPLSGGASGGGAIQGGDGAPGGGVGIPGAIVNGTTREGIGEASTEDPGASTPVYRALATAPAADAGQPTGGAMAHAHHQAGKRGAY